MSDTIELRNGGRIPVDALARNAVDTVYCVPGESYLAALGALHDTHGIRTIVTRREGAASNMADAYGKLVAMEACGGTHYWARKLRSLGHDVRLIPPQFAAPYRKGGPHVKNDAQDAEAICEAASRPQMRFVPIRSPAQQSVLVLHRMRTGFVEDVVGTPSAVIPATYM